MVLGIITFFVPSSSQANFRNFPHLPSKNCTHYHSLLSHTPRKPLIHFLSMDLPILNSYEAVSVCLLSFSITSSKFIYVVVCNGTSFLLMAEYFNIIILPLFAHLSGYALLCCIHFLVIVNLLGVFMFRFLCG